MSKYLHTEALVLKRQNFADTNRFVTLFSKTEGKISAIAKGVRSLKSTKRASLEPFTQVKVSLVRSHQYYIISESKSIQTFPRLRGDYFKITQAYQILEILDALTAEEEPHPDIYEKVLELLEAIEQPGKSRSYMLSTIRFMLVTLGFGLPAQEDELSLKKHLEGVTEKPLRTREFLILKA